MAERGIIFSAPMVLALLEGRKTQTRRLIKPITKPMREGDILVSWPADAFRREGALFRPPHLVGDRLWVRENFWPWTGSASRRTTVYAADGLWIDWGSGWCSDRPMGKFLTPMTPSIHMERWRSRLDLIVTDVRVQRLHEITPEDCAAEGHPRSPEPSLSEEVHRDAARDWYEDLWRSLHKKPGQTWDENPWIVAYTFRVERRVPDARG